MSDYKESRYSRERTAEEKEAKDREDAEEAERKTRKENEKKDKGDCEREIADLALALNDELEAKFGAGLMDRKELEDMSARVTNLLKKAKEYEVAPRIDLSIIPEYGRLKRNSEDLNVEIKDYVDSVKEPFSEKTAELKIFLDSLKDKNKIQKDVKALDTKKIASYNDILAAIDETDKFIVLNEKLLAGEALLKAEETSLPEIKEQAKTLRTRENEFKISIENELKAVLDKKTEEVKEKEKRVSAGTEREKNKIALKDCEDVCNFMYDIKESLKDTGIDFEIKPDWETVGKYNISKNAELPKILRSEIAEIVNENSLKGEGGKRKELSEAIDDLEPDLKGLQAYLDKMEKNPYFTAAIDAEKNRIKRYLKSYEDKKQAQEDLLEDLKAISEEVEAYIHKSPIEGRTAAESKAFLDSLDTPAKEAAYIACIDTFVDSERKAMEDFNSDYKNIWGDAFPSLKDDDSAWRTVKLENSAEWGIIIGDLEVMHGALKKMNDEQTVKTNIDDLYDADFLKKRDELNALRKKMDQDGVNHKEMNRLVELEGEGRLDAAGRAKMKILREEIRNSDAKYYELLYFKTGIGLDEMDEEIQRLTALDEAGAATTDEIDILNGLIEMRNDFDGLFMAEKSRLEDARKDKKATREDRNELRELSRLSEDLAEADVKMNDVEVLEKQFEADRIRLEDLKLKGTATQLELEELDRAEKKLDELNTSKRDLMSKNEDLLKRRDEYNARYLENSVKELQGLDEDGTATASDLERLQELTALRDCIDDYADSTLSAADPATRDKFAELDELKAKRGDIERERQLSEELESAISRVNIIRTMPVHMLFSKAEADEMARLSRLDGVLTPAEFEELEELRKKKEADMSIITRDSTTGEIKADATFTSDEAKRYDELFKKSLNPENVEFERLKNKRDAFEKEIERIEEENRRMAHEGPRITTVPESELPAEIRKHYMREQTASGALAFGFTALPFFLKKFKGIFKYGWSILTTGKPPKSSKDKK